MDQETDDKYIKYEHIVKLMEIQQKSKTIINKMNKQPDIYYE